VPSTLPPTTSPGGIVAALNPPTPPNTNGTPDRHESVPASEDTSRGDPEPNDRSKGTEDGQRQRDTADRSGPDSEPQDVAERTETIDELAAATRTATGEVDPDALAELMASLPYVPREDEAMMLFVGRSVNATGEVTLVAIASGGAHGVSGAPVSLITVPDPAAGPGKRKVVAVLKVFPKPAEFAMEMSALARLEQIRLRNGQAVSVLAVARTSIDGKPAGVLISTAAPGQELGTTMEEVARAKGEERRRLFAETQEAVEATGRTLAELHAATGSDHKPSSSYMARYIDSMRNILSNLEPMQDLIDEFGVDLGTLRAHAEQLILRFEANPGGSAIVHGDAHAGNFFYQRGTDITMIDTPTVHFSMDADGGATGSPSRDVSYFLRTVAVFGQSFNLNPDEVAALQRAFQLGYAEGGGPPLTPEADKFFRARIIIGEFIAMAKRVHNTKAPESTVEPERREALEEAFRSKVQLIMDAFKAR
jgi:aminoglycoside phosphotransferase (APT) family kinase protein